MSGARLPDGVTFACRVVPDRDRAAVVVEGEVDLATAPEVELRLIELQESHFACVALDLSAVTFIDLTGVRVIKRARERAHALGNHFDLVPAPPPVARLLALVDHTNGAGR
jgi:anti-sigma B factor antagonist